MNNRGFYRLYYIKSINMVAVHLSLKQLIQAVKQLSPSEKLALIEMIWKDDMLIPMAHQDLVNERIKRAKANSIEPLDWDEVS